MTIDEELERLLLTERDNDIMLFAYNAEINRYGLIAAGDLEGLKKDLERSNKDKNSPSRRGVLSSDSLSNEKYHAIIMTALVSRFCIEHGLDIAVSYTLSYIFIIKIDRASTPEEVRAIANEIRIEYCMRMRELSTKQVVSRYVVLAVDYIRAHVQEPITVEQVSNELSVNASYLSKLFKKEMGKSISEYIRDSKIEIAEHMLRHLDDTSLQIANYLGFSSQSHFIQVFRKQTGMTPEEYRKKHYHKSWISEQETKG